MKDLKLKFSQRKQGWWFESIPFKTFFEAQSLQWRVISFEFRLCLSLYVSII